MSAAAFHYIKPNEHEPEAFFVETWYDRHTRNWVTQTKDLNLNQVGDATYTGNKHGAFTAHRWTIDSILHKHCLKSIPFITERIK